MDRRKFLLEQLYVKSRFNQEYLDEDDFIYEGIIGAVAGKTAKVGFTGMAKDMAKDALKNRVSSGIKNTNVGKNIRNNYQNKKMGVVNKMRNISRQIDNDDTVNAVAPMIADFIPSKVKK